MHSEVSFICVYTLYIYVYPLFFTFFSHIGYYRVLNKASCAIQKVIIIYFKYSTVYMLFPVFQFIPSTP